VDKHALQVALLAGAVGYLVAIGIYFAPPRWSLSPLLVFGLCPAALATFTVDPSITTVALTLAPFMRRFMEVSDSLSACARAAADQTPVEREYADRRRVVSAIPV